MKSTHRSYFGRITSRRTRSAGVGGGPPGPWVPAPPGALACLPPNVEYGFAATETDDVVRTATGSFARPSRRITDDNTEIMAADVGDLCLITVDTGGNARLYVPEGIPTEDCQEGGTAFSMSSIPPAALEIMLRGEPVGDDGAYTVPAYAVIGRLPLRVFPSNVMFTDKLQTNTAAKKFQHQTLWAYASGNTNYHIIRSLSTGSKAVDIMDGDGYIPLLDGIPIADARQVPVWKNSGNLFDVRLLYADDVMPRREFRFSKAIGVADVTLVPSDFVTTIVESGTAAATDSETNGGYNLYASAGTTNSDAGVFGIGTIPMKTGRSPWAVWFDVWTGPVITKIRNWVGWFSTNPAGSATPSGHYFGIRYVTATDGTAFWRFCTDDNGSAPTVTTTDVAYTTSTRYRVWFWSNDNGATINCQINEGTIYSHTTNMPTTTTTLGPVARCRTTENVSKSFGFSDLGIRSF